MPKKKHPKDMTSEEIAKAVFPKEVEKRLKEIAQQSQKEKRKSSSRK